MKASRGSQCISFESADLLQFAANLKVAATADSLRV
jgi:hypothetical protein